MAPLVPASAPGVEFSVEVGVGNVGDDETFLYDDPAALYDTALYSGSAITWLEAAPLTLAANTNRGRDTFGERFRTGSLDVLFDNQDGLLNPDLGVSLGSLTLRPGRFLRIRGRVKGDQDYETIALGYINSLGDIYRAAAFGINSKFVCQDLMGYMSRINEPALTVPVPAGQATDARVGQVLELAGFDPVNVPPLDPGVNTMQESSLAENYLELCMQAADAEGGAFYMDRTGAPRFRNQTWLEDGPNEGSVQYDAGIGTGVEILDAATEWDLSRVRNDVQLARAGGVAQRVADSASQAAYGRRTFRNFNLQNETDVQVFALAEEQVRRFAWDRMRIKTLRLTATTEAAARLLLQTDVGWRIRVTITTLGNRPPDAWSYTQTVWVNRIRHHVDASDWYVDLVVDSTAVGNPFLGGPYESEAYSNTEYKTGLPGP